MPREHLDAVGQLEQPPERVEEPFRALCGLDREVGSGCVAHEERVAREHEPRLVGPRRVDHREAAVLGSVAGRVHRPDPDVPDLELVAVHERIVRIVDPGGGWMLTGTSCSSARRPCPETWSACVCVSTVRTMRTPSRSASASDRLDRERRVDHDRLARLLATDEVRRAAEILVQHLREEHGAGR